MRGSAKKRFLLDKKRAVAVAKGLRQIRGDGLQEHPNPSPETFFQRSATTLQVILRAFQAISLGRYR